MLLLLLPLKNGLLRHRGLQGLECLPDNLSADIHLFLMSQGRIAERMGDRNSRNNPVRSNRQGNRYDRGNSGACGLSEREPQTFFVIFNIF